MATRLLHLSTSHGGRRLFHSSRAARAGGEGPTYEPGGYLFNQKPGVKYEREWWEIPMYFGFGGASIALLVVYNYKPNSSPTEWARVEAERRLAARGETFGWPFPPNYRHDKLAPKEYPQSS